MKLNDSSIEEFNEMTDNLSRKTNELNNLNKTETKPGEEEVLKNNEDQMNQQDQQNKIEQLIKSYLQNNEIKLLIFSISKNGQISLEFNQSLIQLSINLTKYNIPFELLILKNELDLDYAKNAAIANLLANNYTHLMFIDEEISFNWINVVNFIISDKDICGSSTTDKNINWQKLFNNYDNEIAEIRNASTEEGKNKKIDINYLLAKSFNYDLDPFLVTDENNDSDEQKVVVEIIFES